MFESLANSNDQFATIYLNGDVLIILEYSWNRQRLFLFKKSNDIFVNLHLQHCTMTIRTLLSMKRHPSITMFLSSLCSVVLP